MDYVPSKNRYTGNKILWFGILFMYGIDNYSCSTHEKTEAHS